MTPRLALSLFCLVALSAPLVATAATSMACIAQRACMGTNCRDAAGMAIDFDLTYDAASANLDFDDPTLPVTETLQYRGQNDGAPIYIFRQPELMVAVEIHEADVPPHVRVAFGAPDAPETANQIFATCTLQEAR